MLQRYILVWLLVSSGAAWCWPILKLPSDPFLWLGAGSIHWLIPIAMFCVGALLPIDEVNQLADRWRLVLCGTAVQYTCMPLLAWTTVQYLNPGPELAAGIMIVGCVPGAVASNVLTLTAHGNVSYSVSLTTAATLLSPLVVPIVLRLTLGTTIEYRGADAVQLLLMQIVMPVVCGHLLSRQWPGFRRLANSGGPMLANVAILTVIAIAVALKRDEVRGVSLTLLAPLLAMNLLGYMAGYGMAGGLRFPESMRRALSLEVGMQNAGAGTALAVQLFGADSVAILPCVIYTFGCMLTGTILASIWNRHPAATALHAGAVDSQKDGMITTD